MPCGVLIFTALFEIFYGYRIFPKLEFFSLLSFIPSNWTRHHDKNIVRIKKLRLYFKSSKFRYPFTLKNIITHSHTQTRYDNEQPKIRSHSSRVLRLFNRRNFSIIVYLITHLFLFLSISMMMLMFFRSMLWIANFWTILCINQFSVLLIYHITNPKRKCWRKELLQTKCMFTRIFFEITDMLRKTP